MNWNRQRRAAFLTAGCLSLILIPLTTSAQPAGDSMSATPKAQLNPSLHFAGYASCLARGCHGGADLDRDGKPAPAVLGNSATVWMNHDRHARSYAILKSPRSREILLRLADAGVLTSSVDPHEPRPEREERCLACHVTPTLAPAARMANPEHMEDVWSEGVSCDACHTKPGYDSWGWVDSHPRGELQECLTNPSRGVRSLDSAAKRAQVCVGCHVGAPADAHAGIPLRDMDHTFIAAGHPRLFFDYATYLQLMPPHWQERQHTVNPTTKNDPTGEVAAAAVGVAAELSAELALVADRAQQPEVRSSLSSLDCYACHHDLVSDSWRQQATRKGRLGRAVWLGAELLESTSPWIIPADAPERTALSAVSESVSRFRSVDVQQVTMLQDQLLKVSVSGPDQSSTVLPEWPMVRVSENGNAAYAALSWDQAARRYYLAREMERIRRTRLAQPRLAADADVDGALQAFRESLVYRKSDSGLLSPKDYDPQSAAELYSRVRNLVVQRWDEAIQQAASTSR